MFDLSLRRARRAGGRCVSLVLGRYSTSSGDAVGEELAGRIRAGQVRSVLRHMAPMTAVTAFNGAVLVASLRREADTLLLCLFAALLAGLLGPAAARRLNSSRSRPRVRASAGVLRRLNRNALLLGTLWGSVPVLFFADASESSRLVITSLCAGMIGGGAFVFASVPGAALAMILPIAGGAVFALARAGGAEYLAVMLLTAGYCGALIAGVLMHAMENMRQLIARGEIGRPGRRDPLTGLDNRAAFHGHVAEAMLRLERSRGSAAVFFADIDDLKKLNELHGHAAGDAVLMEAAARLQNLMRSTDRLARHDGGRFAILAPGLGGAATVRAYAARLAGAFLEPFMHGGAALKASMSVGAFIARDGERDAGTALRGAELALRRAQRSGRGAHHLFGPEDDTEMMDKTALADDLALALEKGEFSLAFQPMLRISGQSIEGFEALLRWRHPTRGNVPPSVFIPLAEETGMIVPIGAWVMREACLAAGAWPRDMRVCVNVSAHQLRTDALCALTAAALEEARIEPRQLEIEITETVLVEDDPAPLAVLTRLRASGVRLALDDFGTGHSSLSYLRRLPFDRIKIDRSFITDIVTSADCAAIVKSTIGLARDLGMEVTAEGIETAGQLAKLAALNCPEAQGYLIGRPMPEAQIAAYLTTGFAFETAA